MAIRPTKGSGIGQVSPFDFLDRGLDASSLLGAGVNPRRSGIRQAIDLSGQNNKILPRNFSLTDVSPVPGSVGMSEVPVTGAPDLTPSFITTDDPAGFSILTPRGQESLDEFLGMLSIAPRPGGPAQVRDAKAAARAQGLDPDIGPGGLDFDMPNMDAFKAFMDYDPNKDAGFAASFINAQKDVMSQDPMNTMAYRSANAAASAADAEEGAASGSGAGGDGTSTTDADGNALGAVDYDSVSQFPTDSDDPDESPAEKAFKSGMDAYLAALGQKSDVGSIDDYKKQFSDATGIDTSGKVDNSTALMAFGLALMQNKAGKGFDVGEMLSAVGSAGEKALPAVAAAKKEAKAGQVAAGKFALQQRANDITTAISRRNKIADRIAELSDKAYDRDTQLAVEQLKGTIKLEDRRLQELAANQRASTESLANAGKLGEPKKILVGGFDKNKFEVQAQQVGDTNVFQIINPKGAMRTVDSMIRGSSSGLETAQRMKEIAASGEITGYKNLFNTLQLVGEGVFSVPYSGEVDNKQAEYKAAVGKMLTQFRRLLTGGEAGNAISDRDVAIIEKNLGYLEQSLLGNVAVSSQEIIAKVENLEEMFEARLRDHSDFKRSLIEMGQPAGQYMEYNLGEDDDFTDDFLPNYTLTKGPTGNPRYVLKG